MAPSRVPGSVQVRELRWGDFPDLLGIYQACYDEREAGAPIGIPLMRERPGEAFGVDWFAGLYKRVRAGLSIVVVAEEGGRAIGSCTVGASYPGGETDHVGVLSILIGREHRSRGVGAALLRAAIEQSRGRYDAIELEVLESNPRARALYERLGFRSIGRLPRARQRNGQFDASEWMVLPLART